MKGITSEERNDLSEERECPKRGMGEKKKMDPEQLMGGGGRKKKRKEIKKKKKERVGVPEAEERKWG